MVLLGQLKLADSHGNPVLQGRPLRNRFSRQSGTDLRKDPGIAKGASADHQAVSPGPFGAAKGRFRTGNIAIGNHGYGQLLLHLPNGIPVRNAGIELTSGAPVNGDHGRAAVFHPSGKIQHVDAPLVPAQAALDCHWHRNRPHHGFHNSSRQLRITHQSGAIPGIGDLRHGAAHIDVQKITAGNLQGQPGPLCHGSRVIAEYLGSADASGILTQKLCGFLVLVDQCPGGNHLRHRYPRPQLGADGPEGPVRHTGQGGKE